MCTPSVICANLFVLCVEHQRSERAWKILVTCWTLMMFHGCGFESVVAIFHAYSCSYSIEAYVDAWATVTANSRWCPWNVLNVHATRSSRLSLHWCSVHKMNEFAQGGKEPGWRLTSYMLLLLSLIYSCQHSFTLASCSELASSP